MTWRADAVVVGGGILGLATAWQLSRRRPDARIVVLEKEAGLARHQSGRNSGVLHAGLYYEPGSHKAENCRVGREAMVRFCAEQGIAHELCGKLIVAVDEREVGLLEGLQTRALQNGVPCERWGPERIREREPHAAGLAALHVPSTGIVDFGAVCERLAELLRADGQSVLVDAPVRAILPRARSTVVESAAGEIETRVLVNCAGLHSDRVARMGGRRPRARIVPFRGEYRLLREERHHLCRHLIYPVPLPGLPFLGVHFTRRIDGRVECGPNAVLAPSREAYEGQAVELGDLAETLTYRGFWRMGARHWRVGLAETWRSRSPRAFARALRRLVPEIEASDLVPTGSGIRAQALLADGSFVGDFLIEQDERAVHVLNAPSPAATASLVLGERIAILAEGRLE